MSGWLSLLTHVQQILRERPAQIDVAGQRLHFLAVDQQLHAVTPGRFAVSASTRV